MYISGIHTYEDFYGHSIIESCQSSPQPQQEVLPADQQPKPPGEGRMMGSGIARGDMAWALSGLGKDRVLAQYHFFVGAEALRGKEKRKEEHFCL